MSAGAAAPPDGDLDEPPLLVELAHRAGLTAFERNVVLLAASMELDTRIPALCARAHRAPTMSYPTFALAMTIFDDPSWDALSPEGPLRFWRLIDAARIGAEPLTSARLRADDRVVNFIKGLHHLDERLAAVVHALPGPQPAASPTRSARSPTTSPPGSPGCAGNPHPRRPCSCSVPTVTASGSSRPRWPAARSCACSSSPPTTCPPTRPSWPRSPGCGTVRRCSRRCRSTSTRTMSTARARPRPPCVAGSGRRPASCSSTSVSPGRTSPTAPSRPTWAARRRPSSWPRGVRRFPGRRDVARRLTGQFDLDLTTIGRIGEGAGGDQRSDPWAACLVHTRPASTNWPGGCAPCRLG
ncbi:hypothetical protein G7085_06980 [Tessaracoccus sp. HDW20]|uniref:hypothetical protein n=1 Tax=Tessaracoccus coleopterorum TaxID=2714950 RepID=UPI0018D4D522|nr:hypothetical protein [Tessaracoccus coleopterorum]NHB84435.1 hypothetical protein [Tessaracoccus coleopterorum]